MDTFLIVGLMGIGAIMVGFVGFKFYTDSIIYEQEQEIAALRTENNRLRITNLRLRVAVIESKHGGKVVVSERPADRPQAIVKPDFKKW